MYARSHTRRPTQESCCQVEHAGNHDARRPYDRRDERQGKTTDVIAEAHKRGKHAILGLAATREQHGAAETNDRRGKRHHRNEQQARIKLEAHKRIHHRARQRDIEEQARKHVLGFRFNEAGVRAYGADNDDKRVSLAESKISNMEVGPFRKNVPTLAPAH